MSAGATDTFLRPSTVSTSTSSVTSSPSSQSTTVSNTSSRFGTIIPNRIFVGGIAANTTEQELRTFFTSFGAVKDAKIVVDRSGLSKGSYAFVTFESQDVAEKIIKNEAENLQFKERKLNIGQAVRKQGSFTRSDNGLVMSTAVTTSLPLYPNGLSLLQLANQEYPSIVSQHAMYNQMMSSLPQQLYMTQSPLAYPAVNLHSQSHTAPAEQPWSATTTSLTNALPSTTPSALVAQQLRWPNQANIYANALNNNMSTALPPIMPTGSTNVPALFSLGSTAPEPSPGLLGLDSLQSAQLQYLQQLSALDYAATASALQPSSALAAAGGGVNLAAGAATGEASLNLDDSLEHQQPSKRRRFEAPASSTYGTTSLGRGTMFYNLATGTYSLE